MSQPTSECRCNKPSYPTYEDAARDALNRKLGPTTQLVSYQCPVDDDTWHLSSHPTARGLRRTA